MQYQQQTDFSHEARQCAGVLLTNLGTPDAPDTGALRRFLAEFLADPRVVERPRWLWLPILYGVILALRPRQSAKAYRKIWTDEGSPLLAISSRLKDAVAERLRRDTGADVPVALGMRYGRPSIENALEELRARGATRLVVLPLYPQYSATTTGSTFDAVAAVLQRRRWVPALRFISHYHDDPGYIAALAESVRTFRAEHGAGETLLLSFHGIPKRYFDAGDPYYCHCQKTARLLGEALDLDGDALAVSFQSRVGPEEWLGPYTDEWLEQRAKRGPGGVDVAAPGFAVDCLETLEEIALRYREAFEAKGGTLRYIPALNDGEAHVTALCKRLTAEAGDWFEHADDAGARLERARALGADR